MKSVCIITSVHPHDDVRIFHKEAKALRDAGYAVTILCPDFTGTKEGITFVQLGFATERKKRIVTSWKIAYDFAKKVDADIFHLHDPELLPAAKRLKKLGRHVVYDAHEEIGKQILAKLWIPVWLRKTTAKRVEKYLYNTVKQLDLCVAATENIGKQFTNAILVHNYPDIEEAEANDPKIPYCLREECLCYVGALTTNRGIKESILATGKTKATLLLAGSYESVPLQCELEQMPQYKQVHYLGNISRSDVWNTLGKSRIGLLLLEGTPAYRESMPIKLFEYMLAGLPVIASDFPLWRDLIGTSCAYFVDSKDIDSIAERIQYLLDNPDIAQKMGEAGRKRAKEHFLFAREKEKLLRGYEKILNGLEDNREDL